MANHRIRYTPRDGFDGAQALKTVNLATFPGLSLYRALPKSDVKVRFPPGREYRAIATDGWLEYELEVRGIAENSQRHRDISAFLSEADGGVEFEFAYNDDKTYSTTLALASNPIDGGPKVVDFSADPEGDYNLVVGDWIFIRANWKRSIWHWSPVLSLVGFGTVGSITLAGGLDFWIDAGAILTHRDFVPKARLISQSFSKRRGGQGVDLWDLRLKFREVA